MSRLAWAAEASVEALAEAAPDALVVVDTQACILLANTLAVQLFGYERDELIGQAVARQPIGSLDQPLRGAQP